MAAASSSSVKMLAPSNHLGAVLLNAGHGPSDRWEGTIIVPMHIPPSPEASEYITWFLLCTIGNVRHGMRVKFLNHHFNSEMISFVRR